MRAQQIQIRSLSELPAGLASLDAPDTATWALVFGSASRMRDPALYTLLRTAMPQAVIAGCSTAGEITGKGIADDSVVITLLHSRKVRVGAAHTELHGMADSEAAGRRLGTALQASDLGAVLIFGQGVDINGSALIDGLRAVLGDGVPITGGLAGDGGKFQETVVLTPAGPSTHAVVALGLSRDGLAFNHGSFGGWEAFGTLRRVTRAAGNVLFELDGQPALNIYKAYLGDYAASLPSSGLLFPFEMIDASRSATGVIRTILGVNEAEGSLTLAGDIDPNGYLQLMHASTDRLIDGAEAAAEAARAMADHPGEGLGLLVSCVGRKLVMGERIDEEIEAVGDIFGQNTLLTGFYSYGEISPYAPGTNCRLHNQTMTVTWIGETA